MWVLKECYRRPCGRRHADDDGPIGCDDTLPSCQSTEVDYEITPMELYLQMRYNFRYYGDPILRKVLPPVKEITPEIKDLVSDMYRIMKQASGIGLAANQIGIEHRVAVVEVDNFKLTLINPVIKPHEAAKLENFEEGCLSIPGIYEPIARPDSIEVEALYEDGEPYKASLNGMLARVVQHEVDHLNGKLFIDHLSPVKRDLLVKRWKKANGLA